MTRKRHSAGSYDVLRSKKPVLRSMFLKRGSAVVLLPTTARLTPLLEEVAARLRTVGSFFAKVRVDDELAVRFGAEPFARAATLRSDLERELRWAVDRVWHEQEAHVRIVFGPWRLGDSWFSHWDDEDGIACVSMAGWDGQFEVSAAAFVAYEVALHGLRAAKNNYDPNALWHKETRGCMFDFCQDRADVEVKLQAFDLCDDCRARLDEWGMPRETLDALADTIRDLATRVPVEARHAGG